ncbi:histidine kinase [Actinokineospora auranticolor]|uniref:histidine kinase n=1 Tax=Actinokineospora auranticolor TaxID=155976 RepID=A0A2S6GKE5_9PSEU|nr:histidine kinase [Actinokineospora auranticolor]PPK65631.1 signal transduction histidine kinase [Actinokineospora auranticolor]
MIEQRARVWLGVLRHTVLTGTGRATSRSTALHRLRVLAVLGYGLWAAFVSMAAGSAPRGTLVVNGLLTLVPCLLATRSSLWAWRALVVGIVVTPLLPSTLVGFWGWPWPPGLAMVAALVFALVGANNDQLAVACAGLFSAAAVIPFPTDWRDAAFAVVLGAIPFFLGNAVRQRRVAERARAADRERGLAEEARAALVAARTGIARELHDVVAHHMSVLAVRADSARYRFPGLDDDARREFADLAGTAREGLTELRRLLGVLRSDDHDTLLVPQPGLTAIGDLVDRVRTAGTSCDLDVRGDLAAVPTGVALSVCRIAQEALSNAIRHAPGAPVTVELVTEPGAVRLVVDNGPGDGSGPRQDGAGHGLVGMRERAAVLAADLEARPRPDGGFRVALTVPLEDEQ